MITHLNRSAPAASYESQGIFAPDRFGWVDQPSQRGTIDIIWSCLATLFVCVWVMLHLNVPAKDDSNQTLFLRRVRWLVIAVLAPELVMLFASGQWASAKRSVGEMKSSRFSEWSMVHAFYADSGGFVLQAKNSASFPVTAKQIHYLVEAKYIPMPTISKAEIWDKSNADRFAKYVACFQAGWLVLQVTARAVQHLPVTLLELSTVALISCAGPTFFFWFCTFPVLIPSFGYQADQHAVKPLNVETPTILLSDYSVADILIEAGDAAQIPFKDTPLDFVEGRLYTSSQMPLHRLWGVQQRPLPRIPNDRDSRMHNLKHVIITAVPTASFSLLHLIGWNFDFPTPVEKLLWRWTCISMGTVLGTGCAIEAGAIIWDNYTTSGLTTLKGYKLKWPTNLLFFVPGFLYFTARFIVIVEVVISLRSLPAGCFQNVDWTSILPHI